LLTLVLAYFIHLTLDIIDAKRCDDLDPLEVYDPAIRLQIKKNLLEYYFLLLQEKLIYFGFSVVFNYLYRYYQPKNFHQ
jgi:hypothetical protein